MHVNCSGHRTVKVLLLFAIGYKEINHLQWLQSPGEVSLHMLKRRYLNRPKNNIVFYE